MTESPTPPPSFHAEVRASWQRFLDTFEPLRPELYRYCRSLTHSPWDAEDLVQDTLSRAFVTLGTLFGEAPEPRAWLFRVASNLWIDRARRHHNEQRLAPALVASRELQAPAEAAADPQAQREAAATLLVSLSPQERVAVLLKDVFDFSSEELAEVLGTTPGAVKAALSRGRARLAETAALRPAERAPAPGALHAFVRAFNDRDLPALAALLLDTSSVEIVGLVTEYGQSAPQDPYTGSFAGTLAPLSFDERGGVPEALLEGYVASSPTCELRAYRDGWLLVFWYDHEQGPRVRTLMRAEVDGDRIGRIRNYFFSPDVVAEVCAELGLAQRSNGYRYWP